MVVEDFEGLRLENMEEHGFGPDVMRQIKICDVCGTASSLKQSKCRKCGASLPEETVFAMYKKLHICCPDCDTVVSADKIYCPQCGKKL